MSQAEIERLIYVKHPDVEKQRSQFLSLSQCPPDEFEFMVFFFNYGNIAYRYLNLSRGEATADDFEDWLEGLPAKIQTRFHADGFEVAKSVLSFQRHVLERRDVGMDEYIKERLRPADWEKLNEFKKIGEDGQ